MRQGVTIVEASLEKVSQLAIPIRNMNDSLGGGRTWQKLAVGSGALSSFELGGAGTILLHFECLDHCSESGEGLVDVLRFGKSSLVDFAVQFLAAGQIHERKLRDKI